MARTIDAVVLHHSSISGDAPQFDDVWSYHNSGAGGKWAQGKGIQYHYFIEKAGFVRPGKREELVGWHAGSDKWNRSSLGVCLAGNFTFEEPTSAQIHALALLLMDIQARYGVSDERIVEHRSVRATTCPGIALGSFFRAERVKILKARLDAAERALERLAGSNRGNMLERLVKRLRGITGI